MKNSKCFNRFFVLGMTILSVLLAAYACVPDDQYCNPGSNYDTCQSGPYDTTQNLRSGPSRSSGVFYPRNIAGESGPFPVLVFGCGAGTQPRAYVDHGNMIASHGFIVIINASDNQGRMNTNAINWIIQQNQTRTSTFYGKVDTNKIAAGGHSLGSLGTFNMADDPRLTTTIHVAGGAGNVRSTNNLKNPTIYISGDTDMALTNCRTDYRNTNQVPVFFTVQRNVDHIACAREGLPAIIAWLRWHLYGENQRSAEFLQQGGEFTTGKWQSQSKNW